jgi:deoxyribodipyrimidine photo-lyase
VYKQDGNPYAIFTPYARQWRSSLLPFHIRKTPDRINTPAGLISKPIPTSTPHLLFPAGEQAAQERLKIFLKNDIQAYSTNKDRLGEDGTSLLSPYLHFGVLSARFVYQQAQLQKQLETSTASVEGIEAWVNELIWRDFYTMILAHFPAVLNGPYREEYAHIQWIDREEDFALWRSGLTGYPLVDAGMRQLQECGWMHNRARMIVASFLCKDLLINWQWGEGWFYQHLIDGDLAANNGGWQWSAGTGTDAAPYFRIFNPITQSRKFDPSGSYIRRWVPVLKRVPDIYIHTPWEMPLDIQQNVNCIIGKDYPLPIVEHTFARQRTLEAYKMVKK